MRFLRILNRGHSIVVGVSRDDDMTVRYYKNLRVRDVLKPSQLAEQHNINIRSIVINVSAAVTIEIRKFKAASIGPVY